MGLVKVSRTDFSEASSLSGSLSLYTANALDRIEPHSYNDRSLILQGIIRCEPKGILMAKKFVRAVFPGSFDPITNGHLDVIQRGTKLFDELIIAVGRSPVKNQLFTPEERIEMIAELITDMPGLSVESFDGLTVEYAAEIKADVILRGLRSLTDVQYEFQLAMTNRAVAGIETIFIMTSEQFGFTSSTLIREVASLGGNLSNLVPKNVYDRIQQRFDRKK